jgi:hypothetical protein
MSKLDSLLYINNNSLIVFLSRSHVCHLLVVCDIPSDWLHGQSLTRVIPVPACIILRCFLGFCPLLAEFDDLHSDEPLLLLEPC